MGGSLIAAIGIRTNIDDAGPRKRYSKGMVTRLQKFPDRAAAGVALARELRSWLLPPPLLILALPRGGVAVAYEVARLLDAPLDVMIVRKIGMPGQPEIALGAIASGGVTVRMASGDKEFAAATPGFDELAAAERPELERRERAYRPDATPLDLRRKTVILVDDGLATGATMLAAVRAARKAGATTVVAAAPVASSAAAVLVRREADATVILQIPPALFAISQWYQDFGQVDDAAVRDLLTLSRRHRNHARRGGA